MVESSPINLVTKFEHFEPFEILFLSLNQLVFLDSLSNLVCYCLAADFRQRLRDKKERIYGRASN